jgi:hypothetical protein
MQQITFAAMATDNLYQLVIIQLLMMDRRIHVQITMYAPLVLFVRMVYSSFVPKDNMVRRGA